MYLLGVCFLFVDLVYLFWSLRADNLEVVGLMTIGLSGILCIFLAFYFSRSVRVGGGELWPEDRADANIDDGNSELGFFSPFSWWPVLLAAAVSILFLGVAISAWIALIAIPFLALCTIGWVFEYYRGYFAR